MFQDYKPTPRENRDGTTVLLVGGPFDGTTVSREVVERYSEGQDGRFWVSNADYQAFYCLPGRGNVATFVKVLYRHLLCSDHDVMVATLLHDVNTDLFRDGMGRIRCAGVC